MTGPSGSFLSLLELSICDGRGLGLKLREGVSVGKKEGHGATLLRPSGPKVPKELLTVALEPSAHWARPSAASGAPANRHSSPSSHSYKEKLSQSCLRESLYTWELSPPPIQTSDGAGGGYTQGLTKTVWCTDGKRCNPPAMLVGRCGHH